MTFTQNSKLIYSGYEMFTYKSSMTSVIFLSSVISDMLLRMLCKRMRTRPFVHLPRPLRLHSLHDDSVTYWIQIVPYSISVDSWVQGSDVRDLLHPSFKPTGSRDHGKLARFCCNISYCGIFSGYTHR